MGRPVGLPKTGGRKKGTPNKFSFDANAVAEEMGVDPLQVLLELCSHPNAGIRVSASKEAAKYLYTQKRAVEVSGNAEKPIQVESSAVKEILADLKSIIDTKINERKA